MAVLQPIILEPITALFTYFQFIELFGIISGNIRLADFLHKTQQFCKEQHIYDHKF